MDIERIKRGKIEFSKQKIRLKEVLDAARDLSLPAIRAKNQSLNLSCADEKLMVEVDPARMTQAIGNLLINASKFSGSGRRICLKCAAEGGQAAISVRDEGIGIDSETLPKIFELFRQVDSRAAAGGLGLGLPLAKAIVEAQGGAISAESAGLNHGSTFTIRLPLVPYSEAEAAAVPAGETRAKRRIMVVDDNEDAARLLGWLLEGMNQEVSIALSGVQALENAKAFKPDLVLMDLAMPGMDGYETARRLREMREVEHASLVAVTGWAQEEARQRAQAAGFDGHLVKPIQMDVLEKVLSHHR
jgi:CheY-like chemotaxis protein